MKYAFRFYNSTMPSYWTEAFDTIVERKFMMLSMCVWSHLQQYVVYSHQICMPCFFPWLSIYPFSEYLRLILLLVLVLSCCFLWPDLCTTKHCTLHLVFCVCFFSLCSFQFVRFLNFSIYFLVCISRYVFRAAAMLAHASLLIYFQHLSFLCLGELLVRILRCALFISFS